MCIVVSNMADLADRCPSQVFSLILQSLVSVPKDDLPSSENEFPINFEYTHTKAARKENKKNSGEKESIDRHGSSIMEQKLYNLYESARESGKDQLQIRLSSKPTGAELYSLHALPMLSRSYAEKYPEKLEEYESMRSPGYESLQKSNEFMDHMLEETGRMDTTLIAEVLVYCDEIFWVTDVQTGMLLQGHDDNKIRQVVHGVRLERVISWVRNHGRRKENWLITGK